MAKISTPISNDFCPQTLFLYGTYKEDGTANFGLFCWFSYCWDETLGVMACIGGDKLTKDRIKATKVFSANLVTENMLPLADYFGNKKGYDIDKMDFMLEIENGKILNVPILACSPVSFELEVSKQIELVDSEVFLCKIRNVLTEESLTGPETSLEERLNYISPVCTTCTSYFSFDGKLLGEWGEPQNEFECEKMKNRN